MLPLAAVILASPRVFIWFWFDAEEYTKKSFEDLMRGFERNDESPKATNSGAQTSTSKEDPS
jgi:hypothetical protein